MTAAAFHRVLALAVIASLVRGDAEEPRLELRVPLKGVQALDDREENFLANLFHVFTGEVRRQLKHEPGGCAVVEIEERIPSLCIARFAAGQQCGFGT